MTPTRKVLVAEDSSVIINLTKNVLMFENYHITAVKNGKQVLEKLSNEDFDLILMDINMPLMDGIECTTAIRALPDQKKSKIPIVAITGNYKNYTMDDFKKAGLNDYVQKPLDYDLLLATVKKYLS
ncbi:response regulator [Cecembia calidifontis]|jgi:CheY-like chemotaxis protein|uniref:Response regulator receiver domain-containing protein n=1 Tax=Cecembia calidifontis TaxID=1187080 RepID=A0A4Q7PDY4_9BACT|nr:response regulator [Cecembia calidifontis]RZS97032.1 response regulator receiver domain-containing protein [Cecembia calidifontis]